MNEKNIPDAERLVELLRAELAFYETLLELSRSQKELIDAGRMEELMPLLGEKQRIIDEISAIEEELRPVKANWATLEGTLEPGPRDTATGLIGGIEEVLGRIVTLERSVEQALRSARQEVLDRMTALKDKGRAAKAYGSKPEKDGKTRFFDQKK